MRGEQREEGREGGEGKGEIRMYHQMEYLILAEINIFSLF